MDSLGYYVFKFSDDHGRTWSSRRYEVPIREFVCDRANVYGGQLRFFWNVGRPIVAGNAMLLPHHKVGAMGAGFFSQSEGVFLRSANILTERDPERLRFETLPVGDIGLRTPPGGGRIAEEQSVVELSDGSLFCVYRSVDGVLCDGGDERQFGWGRFSADVRPPTGPLTVAPAVRCLRLYNRPLRTSEAVGNATMEPYSSNVR